jgi:hypothetical protein
VLLISRRTSFLQRFCRSLIRYDTSHFRDAHYGYDRHGTIPYIQACLSRSHDKHSASCRRQALHQATQSLITTEEEEREDVIWPLSDSDAEIISANQYHLLHEFMRDILGTATHRRGS